jgi:hypothetical protein
LTPRLRVGVAVVLDELLRRPPLATRHRAGPAPNNYLHMRRKRLLMEDDRRKVANDVVDTRLPGPLRFQGTYTNPPIV